MMGILGIFVVCGIFIFENFTATHGQVCDSSMYTLIEDVRSTQTVYNEAVDIPLCDDGLDEDLWYRFRSHSGGSVVERAANDFVPINHCGTDAPIYIRGIGSHPSVDSRTAAATVCANYGGNPCNWMETIQIHRCPALGTESVYFLYKLKAPPGCALAYCVGNQSFCPTRKYRVGDSCVDLFPLMSGFPKFLGPYTTGSEIAMEVYFTCTVQYMRQSGDTDARFRVTFLFDGQTIENVKFMKHSNKSFEALPKFYLTTENSSTPVVLGENYLRGRLGREISCKAESYWDGYEPAYELSNSTMISQTKFYAAMESEHSKYILSPSQSTYTIVFRSTLPLTCTHCSGQTNCRCEYVFRMLSNSTSVSKKTCAVRWTSGNTASAEVYVLPSLSQSKEFYVMTFEAYNDDTVINSKSLWRDYLLPPVMVETEKLLLTYLHCSSVTDPYITTFDGVSFWNLLADDFYLVRTNQSMEIQVRQEVCSQGGCNCGVIVREGNSAFKISICERGPWNATVQRSPTVTRLLSQDPVDSSTVYRDGTGNQFSIRMPSGLRVDVNIGIPWFNIHVYLPPVYHGKTSSNSMCGNSNGDRADDKNSASQFRIIADEDDYFRSPPPCSSVFNTGVKRCACGNSSGPVFKCSNTDKLLQLVSKPQNPLPARWHGGLVCHHDRKRRSYREIREATVAMEADFFLDSDVLYPPYSYDPSFGVNVSFTWPTPKGKTELAVTQYCENMVNSSLVYKECNASVDVEGIVRGCKTDIQVVDEWLPGGPYVSILEENCVNQLAASINSSDFDNSSDSGNSSDSDSSSIFAILTSVYEKSCPNQCNNQGTCIKATCVCNQGFIGTDCGMKENQPPVLTDIIRNGICDVRQRPCDVIAVFGSGIISTAALMCRFMDPSTGSYVETNGTFITSGEYSCPVPATTTHRRKREATAKTTAIFKADVSVTMNEVLYSNNIPFVIFDSTCMQCSNSKTCIQRSDACAIDGQCYANREINSNNRCLQCVPETNLTSWTDTTVVQEWKPCTRQCDLGARSKDALCSGTVFSSQVELCKVTDCPENEDEEHKGVGFTLSEEDLKKILTDPDELFNPIADALNSYCSTNAVLCCHSVGVSTTSVTSLSYTSPNSTTYASGYPMLTTSDSHMVKIIVKIDKNRLMAECAGTEPLSSNIVYAAPRLLHDALSGAKTAIEQELGVTIKSLWSLEPVTSLEPVIHEHVTSEIVIMEPVTTEHVPLGPNIPESIIPEPLTTKPVTQEHVTSDPVTTELDTSIAMAHEPLIPELVTLEPITRDHVTQKTSTQDPVITEKLSRKTFALEPVTSDFFTPEPVTSKHVIKETVSSEPVPSGPNIPESITQEHAASEMVTAEFDIPVAMTPESLIPELVAMEPVTWDHVTQEPSTPEPVTSEHFSTEPVTSKPVTSDHVTPEPVTPEHVIMESVPPELSTLKPVAPELIRPTSKIAATMVLIFPLELGVTTKSDLSPEPVTSLKPVTPEPVPSGPNIQESITPEILTPKPVTQELNIPESITSEWFTPKPVTPEHATSKPVTREPSTAVAITPRPIIPDLLTLAPMTHKPIVSELLTPKPVTLKPVTQKPVTQKPVTPKPVTQKPVTQNPVTQKPVTPKPATPRQLTMAAVISETFTSKTVNPEPVIPGPVPPEPDSPKPVTPKPESVTLRTAGPRPVTPEPRPYTSTAATTCCFLFTILGTYLLFWGF